VHERRQRRRTHRRKQRVTTATKSIRDEAKERVFSREEEVVRQERAEAAEDERIEQVRVSTLAEVNENARNVLELREVTLPAYVAARSRMIELGAVLLEQHRRYGAARRLASRNGGSLDTAWPHIVKIDRHEEELLRQGIQLADQAV
jgi:hypothetical protein